MKYLKMINSFDEFAEDAKAGVVYYDIGESVYYWLNLRTIWGYVGYDAGENKFITNGKEWSVVPPVPDPENLLNPTTLNANSFVNTPEEIKFNATGFNMFPLNPAGVSNSYLKIAGSDYSNVNLYLTGTKNSIELVELPFSSISSITTSATSTGSAKQRLIVNSNNGVINLNNTTLTIPQLNYQYKQYDFAFAFDPNLPELESIGEDDIFGGFSSLSSTSINSLKDRLLIDYSDINSIRMDLKEVGEEIRPLSQCRGIQDGSTLYINAKDSNGEVRDDFYQYLHIRDWSSSVYFNNIVYKNVTDYGSYYKRYLRSSDYLPLSQELLNIGKTKYIEFYSDSSVSAETRDIGTYCSQEFDLSGVKHFIYYCGGIEILDSEYKTTLSTITSYDDVIALKAPFKYSSYHILPSCKIINVDLDSFGWPMNNTNSARLLFNTDNDIKIKTLVLHAEESYISAFLCLGPHNITLSGINRDTSLLVEAFPNMGSGKLKIVNWDCQNELKFTSSDNTRQLEANRVEIANALSKANPTPEDYYNLKIDTSAWCQTSYHPNNVDAIDYHIIRNGGLGTGMAPGFVLPDWSRVLCIAGTIDFTYIPSRLTTSAEMQAFISKVPNINKQGSKMTFLPAQYANLTTENINCLVGLGYTVIEHI